MLSRAEASFKKYLTKNTLLWFLSFFFISLLFLLINLLIRDTEQDEEETEMLSHQKMQDF